MISIPDPAVLVGQFYGERNREYVLRGPVFSIGRSPDNSLRIPDPRLSEHQARIEEREGRWVLDVTAPESRTTVNGAPVERGRPAELRHGDVIALADLEFRFSRGEAVHGRLHVLAGVHHGKIFRVDRPVVRVGRAEDNQIQFPDRSVSRHHCLIRLEGEEWWIEDLDTTNGTVVNGRPVGEPERLAGGDVVQMGLSRFRFRDAEDPTLHAGNGGDRQWN